MAKKAQLGYKEIEERLTALRDGSLQADSIGYQLLYAFGKSERDLQRYREGKGVMKTFDGLLIKASSAIVARRPPACKANLKTLADLYDPDKMPQDLREAHARLDDIVESCYPGYPFASDEARLECLFKLYEKMTASTSHLTGNKK